jgi:hypothetical protein
MLPYCSSIIKIDDLKTLVVGEVADFAEGYLIERKRFMRNREGEDSLNHFIIPVP